MPDEDLADKLACGMDHIDAWRVSMLTDMDPCDRRNDEVTAPLPGNHDPNNERYC